jgi:hypothetical protein
MYVPISQADVGGVADRALLSRPACGKHVVFDGRFLHAAPGELDLWGVPHTDSSAPAGAGGGAGGMAAAGGAAAAPREQRVTLLVNIWLNWRPRDAVRCPEDIRRRLGGGSSSGAVALRLGQAGCELTPLPTLEVTAGAPELRWRFRVGGGQQAARVVLLAPLAEIREAASQSGASLLLTRSRAAAAGAVQAGNHDAGEVDDDGAIALVRVETEASGEEAGGRPGKRQRVQPAAT